MTDTIKAPPDVVDDPRVRAIVTDLRAAAAVAQAALRRLNTRHSQCASCQHKEYENFHEFNAYEAVNGVVGKLRRWADVLENPSDYTARGVHLEDNDARQRLRQQMRGRFTRPASPQKGDK